MATSLHRVAANFRWRIEAITPSYTAQGALRPRFVDLDSHTPGQFTGVSRGFEVRRVSRDAPTDATDQYRRIGDHVYVVEVFYAPEFKRNSLEEITAQDAHDLIKALRAPSSWLGYSADNPTTDIGLMDRQEMAGDELVQGSASWSLRVRFRVTVKEIE